MALSLPSLGEYEIQVLRLVWQHQPCTERQISDLIQKDRAVARTTVLKTLQRLEAKGLLMRVPDETPIRFRAAVEAERLLPALISRFVERMLGGSAGPLVAYLADSQKLPDKDVEALRMIAEKMGQTRES
jgi:BlaI family transcriptional regulator, penicillinase repressor